MRATPLLDALCLDHKRVRLEWSRGALAITAPSGVHRVAINFSRDLVNYYAVDQDGDWQFAGVTMLNDHTDTQIPALVNAVRTFLES